MLCSCAFLYVLRRWKIISFTAGESQGKDTNSKILVPLRTVLHTLPLAFSYLIYLVCLFCYAANHFFTAVIFQASLYNYLFFHVKDSFNGVCSRDKCSYVHHSSTDYCGIYYALWVFIGWPETFSLCCWQVSLSIIVFFENVFPITVEENNRPYYLYFTSTYVCIFMDLYILVVLTSNVNH